MKRKSRKPQESVRGEVSNIEEKESRKVKIFTCGRRCKSASPVNVPIARPINNCINPT